MRTWLALLMAGILAGCACTAVGCYNRLRFHPGIDLQSGVAYEIEACVDRSCIEAMPDAIAASGTSGDISLSSDRDFVELALGDADLGGTRVVAFVVRDEAGAVVVSFEGPVAFTRTEPNGGWLCGPTCWSADVSP
jgi:hypothetical protein